jgi:uncharacterized 2Fe-2S/4Fe-4S cluster protein (DUF4445 family)
MPTITFHPSGTSIEAAPDTVLLDVIHKAGILLEASCGGEGVCGKCLVRIRDGCVQSDASQELTESQMDQGYVLACKSRILETAVIVEIPEHGARSGGQFIDETDVMGFIGWDDFIRSQALDPPVAKYLLEVPKPRLQDGLSDLDRFIQEIQSRLGKREIEVPLSIVRQLAGTLREHAGEVTVTVTESCDPVYLRAVESGDRTSDLFGVAIDVGTTTVAVRLVDLKRARSLAVRTAYNGQIDCGQDVISRINYARKPERLEELRTKVLETVNRLTRSACDADAVDVSEVSDAVIAGNTTMIHLLLGLNPEYIRLEPYTPTIMQDLNLTAREIGIEINPETKVYLSPAVGSYVGGDVIAGLLCTDIALDSEQLNLFIDIGTNGEMVVGNREFLLACACSAGPAFEGGGVECGMRAAKGAIDKATVDPQSGIVSYQTVGNGMPAGICGSGMISLLADLFLTGWIDPSGKFNRDRKSGAVQLEGRKARFVVVPAEESASGKPITLTESDIENIIRAKAAVYAACSLMLEQVDLDFTQLDNIFIGGGFGRFLDMEKAVTIGLLPDLPREKYHYLGNSSLLGSCKALLSRKSRQRQSELCRCMTYMELNTNPAYMDQYTGALFLPHTDIGRFPSVKARVPGPSP